MELSTCGCKFTYCCTYQKAIGLFLSPDQETASSQWNSTAHTPQALASSESRDGRHDIPRSSPNVCTSQHSRFTQNIQRPRCTKHPQSKLPSDTAHSRPKKGVLPCWSNIDRHFDVSTHASPRSSSANLIPRVSLWGGGRLKPFSNTVEPRYFELC